MADSIDTPLAPKRRGRKPGSAKAAAQGESAGSSTDFSESVKLAGAAVSSAKKTARAKVTGATEKVKVATGKVKAAKESVSAFDWKKQAEDVTAQASKMAKDTATTAKTKTTSAMDGLAKLITETAQTVDSKLGPQYGDYARKAANAVAGAAKSLDGKDVEELLGDARNFVRKSPAVAIGAAAIAGYVLMRLARGSSDEE
ncbi:hypothetical protein OOT33_05325 [Sphingobium sp. DEHP117]|uniref:hypothetical protein n=1 Tax=Sphingobium sp. DEHP117 TaxID=2993436 RepID=UPI0027D769A8|nr:hypothetical protein [Sphingobium sp. DEHP117]MDQ4419861.1 hypothetical protein [Sphingobium sp. DEHP117]